MLVLVFPILLPACSYHVHAHTHAHALSFPFHLVHDLSHLPITGLLGSTNILFSPPSWSTPFTPTSLLLHRRHPYTTTPSHSSTISTPLVRIPFISHCAQLDGDAVQPPVLEGLSLLQEADPDTLALDTAVGAAPTTPQVAVQIKESGVACVLHIRSTDLIFSRRYPQIAAKPQMDRL